MIKRFVQLFFAIIGGALGFYLGPDLIIFISKLLKINYNFAELIVLPYILAILGIIIILLITNWLTEYLVYLLKKVEESIIKLPMQDIVSGVLGMIIGLIIAFLLAFSINMVPVPILSSYLPIFVSVLLAYLGFQIGFKKREELLTFFGRKEKKKEGKFAEEDYKILDTSVIIDGRIADICKTGFLEGTILIPSFVLAELQHIADSSDVLKRNRGRRGLDILNRIQKELQKKVTVYEIDFDDIQEVDSKLVRLAKILKGKVVTNDFNLNKVCELQGVQVLNINDLANAVKPVVLPGEEMRVQVIKDGKESGQGIAYLDDGTMIVVESGKEYIGLNIEVMVTSVLQTSAGRMIFAKPKLLEKAL